MTFVEEYNLAEQATNGNVRAFARLVRNYSGLVYRVALRILGDEDAQDASQEVWIRVWQNIKNFRGESAFTTWLYKITVNTCLSTTGGGRPESSAASWERLMGVDRT